MILTCELDNYKKALYKVKEEVIDLAKNNKYCITYHICYI